MKKFLRWMGRAVGLVFILGIGAVAFLAFRPMGEFEAGKLDGASAGTDIRILTWNVLRGEEEGWSGASWNRRKESFRAILSETDFDIVCFQEALPDQVSFFSSLFPDHEYVAVDRDGEVAGGESCPIFFRSDRFDLLGTETFWLSPTPDTPSKGWGEVVPRICTWIDLRDRESGRRFRVSNVHLHVHPYGQYRAAYVLSERLSNTTLPTILAGDFNAPPDWPPLRVLNDVGFRDAEQSGALTYHVAGKGIRCLDHILIDDHWSVRDGAILRTKGGEIFPSDHFGLWTELSLKAK